MPRSQMKKGLRCSVRTYRKTGSSHNWRDDVVKIGEIPASYVKDVSRGMVDFLSLWISIEGS